MISVLAAFGRQDILEPSFTAELFLQSIGFLKDFDLENITVLFRFLYNLFVTKFGKEQAIYRIHPDQLFQSFLFENFPVSKMEISIVTKAIRNQSDDLKYDITFEINQDRSEDFELSFTHGYDRVQMLNNLFRSTFKDLNVLEMNLEEIKGIMIHKFGSITLPI